MSFPFKSQMPPLEAFHLLCLCFEMGLHYSSDCPRTYHVTETCLEFTAILLSLVLKCWDYICELTISIQLCYFKYWLSYTPVACSWKHSPPPAWLGPPNHLCWDQRVEPLQLGRLISNAGSFLWGGQEGRSDWSSYRTHCRACMAQRTRRFASQFSTVRGKGSVGS